MNHIAKLMPTKRENAVAFSFAILLAIIFCPSVAKADGGVMRMTETQGPFIITVFTSPEISRDLPADVAVMVQRRETGEVTLDAEVDLDFIPPDGAKIHYAQRPPILATRARSANKLLYGTPVIFPSVGNWEVLVSIRQGGDNTGITCILPVGLPPRRLAGLWPYLALPPLVIALFVMSQWLRRRTILCKSSSVLIGD